MNDKLRNPYDHCAKYSDYVYGMSFGMAGPRLNGRVLAIVNELVPKPGRILEVGAGTGRLTVPIAQAGHAVVAVEPCAGMVAELRTKLAALLAEVRERVSIRRERIEHYRRRDQRFDLILCVFTVLNHLLNRADVEALAQTAFNRLKAGGSLLLGMMTTPVPLAGTESPLRESGTFNLQGFRRQLDLEALGDDHYRLTDLCEGAFPPGETFRYREVRELCLWRPEMIGTIFRSAGFQRDQRHDAADLVRMDAQCLVFRKPDPRSSHSESEDDEDLVKIYLLTMKRTARCLLRVKVWKASRSFRRCRWRNSSP